ncbi:hypothetical protein Vafri_3064 [Volvox africanus]|uniref:Uncharacterized protein n=1 Tax=Volvox africanus TaxID=51714 RepID=A0A8J4ETB0_9CHLO|nr:hypothetical protein Vafri_3064 [Volvox africanus]
MGLGPRVKGQRRYSALAPQRRLNGAVLQPPPISSDDTPAGVCIGNGRGGMPVYAGREVEVGPMGGKGRRAASSASASGLEWRAVKGAAAAAAAGVLAAARKTAQLRAVRNPDLVEFVHVVCRTVVGSLIIFCEMHLSAFAYCYCAEGTEGFMLLGRFLSGDGMGVTLAGFLWNVSLPWSRCD